MAKSEKSWQERLCGQNDELAVDFVKSLSYDKRLYKYDIAGSIAHAQMLAAQGLISKAESAEIKKALFEISEQIAAGKARWARRVTQCKRKGPPATRTALMSRQNGGIVAAPATLSPR